MVAQKRPQLTAGMRLVSVRGENGYSDMNKLGFKDGTERFRTAGRPVTLTLRPEPETQPRLRPQPEPEQEQQQEPERRQHAQQRPQWWRAVQAAKVRSGFEATSSDAGNLQAGQIVEELEFRVNENSITRVRFEGGWVSERTGTGELILEPADSAAIAQAQQARQRQPEQDPDPETVPAPEPEPEPQTQTETEAAQMAAQMRAQLAAKKRQNKQPTTDPRTALEVEPEPEPEADYTGPELELQPEATLNPEPIFGPLVIGVDGCKPRQAEGWLEYKIDDQEEWTMGYFAISVGMMAEMMASVPETGSKDPTATMMATMAKSRAHGQRMGNLGQLWLYTKQDRAKCVRVWSLAGMDVRNSTGEILDSSLEKHLKLVGTAFGSDKVDWLAELRELGGPEEPKISWKQLTSRIRKRVKHRSERDHKKAVETLKSSVGHLIDSEGNISAYDAASLKLFAGEIVQKKDEVSRQSNKSIVRLRCADFDVVAAWITTLRQWLYYHLVEEKSRGGFEARWKSDDVAMSVSSMIFKEHGKEARQFRCALEQHPLSRSQL